MNTHTKQYQQRLYEVLCVMLETPPPMAMLEDWIALRTNDLQDWCVDNSRNVLLWTTGLSIIDAAESIVLGSYENGNIDKNGNVM